MALDLIQVLVGGRLGLQLLNFHESGGEEFRIEISTTQGDPEWLHASGMWRRYRSGIVARSILADGGLILLLPPRVASKLLVGLKYLIEFPELAETGVLRARGQSGWRPIAIADQSSITTPEAAPQAGEMRSGETSPPSSVKTVSSAPQSSQRTKVISLGLVSIAAVLILLGVSFAFYTASHSWVREYIGTIFEEFRRPPAAPAKITTASNVDHPSKNSVCAKLVPEVEFRRVPEWVPPRNALRFFEEARLRYKRYLESLGAENSTGDQKTRERAIGYFYKAACWRSLEVIRDVVEFFRSGPGARDSAAKEIIRTFEL